LPLLTAHQTLDLYEGAANVKVGALARDVVMRGAAAAGAWRRKAAEHARAQPRSYSAGDA